MDKYDLSEDDDIYEHSVEYSLGINCPDLKLNKEFNIEQFIKKSEELTDFYKEIESSIDKVKIKYPQVIVKLEQDNFVDRHTNVELDTLGTRFVWIRFRVYTWSKK